MPGYLFIALTIPGVLHVYVSSMRVGVPGPVSAVICGIFRCHPDIYVFGAVMPVYACYVLIWRP